MHSKAPPNLRPEAIVNPAVFRVAVDGSHPVGPRTRCERSGHGGPEDHFGFWLAK